MRRKLRIIMISPLPPEAPGEAIYTKHLITELVRTGRVVVDAIAGTRADPMEPPIEDVEIFPIWSGQSLLYPFRLLRFIRTRRPDIVHVQFGPHGRVYGGLFGEVMLVLLLLLKACGIRTTITLHSTWMPKQVQHRFRQYGILRYFRYFAPAIFRLFMVFLDWGTDTVQLSTVKVNSSLRSEFIKTYNLRPEKVLEIPHPCGSIQNPPSRDESLRRLGFEGRRVLLMFGFIRPDKGIELAISAMQNIVKRIPNVLLLIAGKPRPPHGRQYLQKILNYLSRSCVKNNITIHDRYIPDEEVPYYFGAASALLIPYTESVGASGPIHNYAGYNVPIVAADVGFHMQETLGGSLVLFKPNNPNDLASKIIETLTNGELVSSLLKKQHGYVMRETWEMGAKRTLHNYFLTLNPQYNTEENLRVN